MKLFTKDIENQLQAQFLKGSDLDNQEVIAKIFNPYGQYKWYLLNQDPADPDYVWCIASNGKGQGGRPIVEVGSVRKSDLENLRINVFGSSLPLERDLGFRPENAGEVYNHLINGEFV